jgi:ferredoxin
VRVRPAGGYLFSNAGLLGAVLSGPGRYCGTDGNDAVKVRIDSERCQGHGRCYDLAPALFGEDEQGYGRVLGAGVVPPGQERQAQLAVVNCPEQAISELPEP